MVTDKIKSESPDNMEFKAFDGQDNVITKYLKKIIGQKITQVSDTTISQAQNVILGGIADGLTFQEIAAQVAELGEIASLIRAENIVATEVCQASNAGGHFAMQQSPIAKYTKHVWSAVGDDRTRPTHINASGQSKDFDRPFELEGGQLMFPGDTSLGVAASETIGCRCVEVFDTSGFSR